MQNIKNYITENLSEVRMLNASKIFSGLKVMNPSLNVGGFNYSTSYGFSFDTLSNLSSFYNIIIDTLDRNNIIYKIDGGSLHREVKISSKKDNLKRFVELGNKYWKIVEKEENKYLKELKDIIDKLDKTPQNSKHPRTNSVLNAEQIIKSHERDYKEKFVFCNFKLMVERYQKLLDVQNNLDAIYKLKEENKNKGLLNSDNRLAVLLDAEIERLTGKS